MVDDFRKDVRAIMASAQKVSRGREGRRGRRAQGRGTVGKLLTDDALYVSAKNIAAAGARRRWRT